LHQQEREQVPLPLSETQQGEQQQQAAGQELQSQPQKAAAQQRQQEPALNAEPPQQQQQQQQQQGPMLPWPGCGSYRVVSVSMDRCFAVSKLDIQPAVTAAPAPAPAPAAGSKGKQGSAGGITLTLPAQPGTKGPTPAAAAAAAVAPSLAAAPAAAASAGSIGFAAGDGSGSSSGGGGGDGSVSLQLSGCDPLWVCQGTGGFVYSCAGQPSFADAVEAWPKYSKVRLAVGSGDKTIRALSLRVRAAPTQQQQQKEGVVAGVSGGSDADADSSAVAAAAAPNGSSAATADGPSSSSSSSSGGGGSAVAAGVCGPELQLPFAKPTLLWKNISDRPQAIAWHPTNPREFDNASYHAGLSGSGFLHCTSCVFCWFLFACLCAAPASGLAVGHTLVRSPCPCCRLPCRASSPSSSHCCFFSLLLQASLPLGVMMAH
jgi:hypothetical protein